MWVLLDGSNVLLSPFLYLVFIHVIWVKLEILKRLEEEEDDDDDDGEKIG